MYVSRGEGCQHSEFNFNPLRLYDCLKVKTIGEVNDKVDDRIAKYSHVVDVYKDQVQMLRSRLDAAEIELKTYRSIEDLFA